HGEMLFSQDRMYKSIWYDESLLVPWLIRWPGRIEPGRDDLLLGAIDIYPTLLGLAGLVDAAPETLDGDDRSGILLGQDDDRPTSAFYLWPNAEIERDRRAFTSARGLRTHRYTFIVGRDLGGDETVILHDNELDPFQLENCAADQPDRVARLQEELHTWLKKTDDPWTRGEIEPSIYPA
ncbi:MAG: sulfatase-like hydrolase/transferase, partial [Phycisphaeraceae bacterium]|nr:sulfatase-like hydrolase/transferase [Phycisphaeraceae bacterium]